MNSRRLPAPHGSRLDRSREITFTFNGRLYTCFKGDTLASALIANGVGLVGRSFKLHRPRGIFSCGLEEPTGLVDVEIHDKRTPNVRATVIEVQDGLCARSVNCWPNVRFDVGMLTSLFSAVLPSGFYYKTFKWPEWRLFEPAIRRMAGLGRIANRRDSDHYDEVSATADVLVIGAGLAGLSTSIAAATRGANVMLLCAGPQVGGRAADCGEATVSHLTKQAHRLGVTVLTRTVAFGIYDHELVCARELLSSSGIASIKGDEPRERLWKIRARAVVAATGAFERPMVFPDNDRPGVMLAGAATRYVGAYGVTCGSRVVIAANSDAAYAVASTLRNVGVDVAAIADARSAIDVCADRSLVDGIATFNNSRISSVLGSRAVRGCTIAHNASNTQTRARIECDLILSAGGFAPVVHFHSMAGGKLRWLDDAAMFVPDGPAPGVVSVGACAGVFSREHLLVHAQAVGDALAGGTTPPIAPVGGAGRSLANTHVARRGAKQFIDLQNDVTASDVELAAREGYRSVEHLKRYTTTGMGTDQGKTSNINAVVVMGACTDRVPAAVGTTKFRPPFTPVTMGLFAGRRVGARLRPLKRLPSESWHASRGAVFEEYGGWRRPAAYPEQHESVEQAALRESAQVRQTAGLFDASPLGKIEIFGPDAAKFLDLMYVGTLSNLRLGQARYGVLLNENGIVVDDGIVARLGEHRFWVNTTTSGAERTANAFEEWLQCEYVDLKVAVTPVTSRWANITIAGPRAWDWLNAAGFEVSLAPSQTLHMSIAHSLWDDSKVIVLRASFSGELSYELNVPVDRSNDLLERLWAHAPTLSATVYGIEALQKLRIEKGYIHVGTDTDGTTLPGDIGVGRSIERKIANFVGRRSLTRPVANDVGRFQLVALIPTDRKSVLPVGAQIAQRKPPTRTEGHVTSSTMSATLGHPVALAMLARGAARTGERVRVHHLGRTLEADIVPSPIFDPQGRRLHG